MHDENRDHLFISYATEDAVFARWLTLKLMGEGYKVWCDQVKLLGGESYPSDIDDAIKQRTFRLLALLSEDSITKANPLKERTLALNLGKERGEDFLIPLNVTGVSETELDWMTSDITYLPFHHGWAAGLRRLLKKLRSIDAPRTFEGSGPALEHWLAAGDCVERRQEQLWSNVFEFTKVPSLIQLLARRKDVRALFSDWPHYRQGGRIWAFELPVDKGLPSGAKLSTVDWRSRPERGRGPDPRHIVVNLLRQYLHRHCSVRGLDEHSDEKRRHHPFFGGDNGNERWLSFGSYTGRRSRIKAVGVRTFRLADGEREQTRYHLEPEFSPNLDLFERPVLLLRLRLYLTDLDGNELPAGKALRRRKRLCRDWWNHEWLTRLLATIEFLADGQEEIDLALSRHCNIILSARPLRGTAQWGIDEETLEVVERDDESRVVDEFDDEVILDGTDG